MFFTYKTRFSLLLQANNLGLWNKYAVDNAIHSSDSNNSKKDEVQPQGSKPESEAERERERSSRKHTRQVHMSVVIATVNVRVLLEKGHASESGIKRKMNAVYNGIFKGTLWNIWKLRQGRGCPFFSLQQQPLKASVHVSGLDNNTSLQKSQRNSSAFNTLSYYSQAVNKVTHGRFITTVVMRLQFYLPLMSDISNHSTAALCVRQNSQGQVLPISLYYVAVYSRFKRTAVFLLKTKPSN